MKIEKNDMVMVYDGGGTVPHCKYTGRFGDLTAYWQEIVSDAVYLFRLGESEECDWLVLLGQPWSPYSPDGIRFDTETTGLHPNGSDSDEILTISIIGRDGSVLLDERFRPTVKTEWPHASAVNGIYPEDVADLPTIETAIPRLREIFAGADEVIGYNVGFDLGFLSAVGVRPREDARITDTMKEFTWFMGRRYKLVDAADHIGYEWTGRAHGSLADALATLAVQRWLEQWLVAE